MLISIGADPGTKNGAIAIINEKLKILELKKLDFISQEIKSKVNSSLKLNKETKKYERTYRTKTWTDPHSFRDLFSRYIKKRNSIIYTVERVFSKHGEGEGNSFIFGNSLGILQGQISYLNPLKYYEPRPQEWKDELGINSTKSLSINLCNELFEDSITNDDNLAEALLLAFLGLKRYYEEV